MSLDPGPKTAIHYIITGELENVRSVATHFEKILGLSAGAAVINEVGTKNQSHTSDIKVRSAEKVKATEEESNGGTPSAGGAAGGGKSRKRGSRKGARGGGNNRKNGKESQNAVEGGGDGS